jgi:hypothetical protein
LKISPFSTILAHEIEPSNIKNFIKNAINLLGREIEVSIKGLFKDSENSLLLFDRDFVFVDIDESLKTLMKTALVLRPDEENDIVLATSRVTILVKPIMQIEEEIEDEEIERE